MRWSREMTNSRDSEVPRPEHRVPDQQSLSTLSPNTSQSFNSAKKLHSGIRTPPSCLCPPHTRGLPHNSFSLAVSAPGDPSHGHGLRRSPSLSHSVSHTLEVPSRPQFSSSHSGIFPSRTLGLCLAVFSFTHRPPHTQSLAHSQNHPGSLSRTHARTRPLARSLAGCACVFLTPPSTQGSTLPASSSQPRRLSRALRPTRFPARIQHAATVAEQSARPHTRRPGPKRNQPRAEPEPAPHLLAPAS